MFSSPQSLQLVIDFLQEHNIPYMVIGGLAMSVWGEIRVTHDADIKVSIDVPLTEFRKLVFEHFPERHSNIPAHKKSQYVVHIWASPDVAIDLLVSIFDYEKKAIERAVEADVLGIPARVCAAEDFIIHKAIANREKDWMDIEIILVRQRGKLNIEYIRNWLSQFAEALENPEIFSRLEDLYRTI